jgi:hypothetical protein
MARVSCKIQKIFDHYVEQNPYFGKTCIAEVAGAASPKLSKKNTSFLVASPVEAKHQNKALPLMLPRAFTAYGCDCDAGSGVAFGSGPH